ncbi:carbohydrate sulfotransferase 11-like isoform X2 [Eriocheir sinensis]|uniref:carbohydrate sulfotransferase 11-like isoform X2 n=1 Tax=Eriocheir sinensis TaxID=95602 RepID=UPI0021C913F9|nr:carbohydrate sulfotransferase 11-like isoform X2 [Eriocheir sinensis]
MVREVSFRAVLVALALPSIACYLLLVRSTPHLAEEDDPWWAGWAQVQRSRREALRLACLQFHGARVKSFSKLLLFRKYLYNLLVDDRHRAIYCYVPKVACTNWKRLMMILSGRTNETNPLNISSHIPHEEGVLTRLSSARYKTSVLSYKLRTYTKFLFVRHPMERLVSAYRNKLASNSSSATDFRRRFGSTMLKVRRGVGAFHNVSKAGRGVTFAEFVYYLIERSYTGGQQSLNEHWAPYFDLCHPCTIRYDNIGKYETLEEDAEFILRKIGARPDLHFPPFVNSKTASLVPGYLATLTEDMSKKLYELYKPDFALFQYEP